MIQKKNRCNGFCKNIIYEKLFKGKTRQFLQFTPKIYDF